MKFQFIQGIPATYLATQFPLLWLSSRGELIVRKQVFQRQVINDLEPLETLFH